MNEYYKRLCEYFKAQTAKEAERCMALEDDYKAAELAVSKMRDELEILKLKKTDPELDDRQRQMLSNLKEKLLEYPTLLGEVTGNETFMQAIKKSYELKLEEFEMTLKGLMRNVFELPMTCSRKVSTLLTDYAETTLKPAINILRDQHEELETELGEANERSTRLEKRIEQLEAEAEKASADTTSLTLEHRIREQRLTNDIAALEKKLEAERQANHAQKQKHQHETTDLVAQLENARTTSAAEVKVFEGEIESYRGTAKELKKGKEALEETVKRWQERVNIRRQEHDEISAKYKANQEQLKTAEDQVLSLEEDLRTEKNAAETATQQAEDAAKQIAGKNEELEETRRQMAKKNEELEERRKQIETQEELLSRKEGLFENRRIDLEKKEELLQRFQSTVTETLRELTGAVPKAQADAQRSLVNYDVSRFEEIRAKRGRGPTSPEEPPPKRRRYTPQSSVGSGEMPTSSTATGQMIINPESSSPGTLIQSNQSTVSATGPPGLSGASDEVKDVWRQIEFPANWDMRASQKLLHGFNKATHKSIAPKYRPAGLLNSSSVQPNCFLGRVSKTKSALDNGDGKSCSICKAKMWPCVRVSFVADDLANVEYDEDGEEKRWKLTIRED